MSIPMNVRTTQIHLLLGDGGSSNKIFMVKMIIITFKEIKFPLLKCFKKQS